MEAQAWYASRISFPSALCDDWEVVGAISVPSKTRGMPDVGPGS